MKLKNKLAIVGCILFIMGLEFAFFKSSVNISPTSHVDGIKFSIYHTNDLHSHFDGVKYSNKDFSGFIKKGGFDRLSSAILKVRNEKISNGEIILGIDAGDLFSGTIFSALGPSYLKSFPEYEFLSKNFYDVMILGNHEFDPMNLGLEKMLSKVSLYQSSEKMATPIVASNIYLKKDTTSLSKYIGSNKLIKNYLIKEYISPKDQKKVKFAFLGILGPDGCRVSTSTREDVGLIGFIDEKHKTDLGALVDFINPLVKELRTKENVQIVVISMHGGGSEVKKLARKISGVDVIIAGHTHEEEFFIENGIIISQTGSYGEKLGLLELTYDEKLKKVFLVNPNKHPIIPIDEQTPPNPYWTKIINDWRKDSFKLMGDDKKNNDEIVFVPKEDHIISSVPFSPAGTFIASSLRDQLNFETTNDVDIYFTSTGLIRTSFYKGVPYTRPEIFELVSIGFDKNSVPGVDVVSFYLTPHEVKLVLNFLELYSFVSPSYSPVFSSNLTFDYTKWGIPFLNRITNIKLNGKNLSDENRLIKIATNKYITNNLGTISKATRGFVKIDPKDKFGKSTRDYPTHSKEYNLLTNYFLRNKN